ncbi:MAG: flagellin [Sulfurimonas sp. RIFOXYD12_FULL_33_39]|uniref:flagellin N-terminal helical domain-containing protein n=1 Tax=unclassified Sulfurimonas TaxID=2623549 RepID=UPI0008D679FF|nr:MULTISPECIES: flagellin [unclassified Sulfurimonas]OHE08962.1 MAG: flagellin [Sulfurimonas sp. RIFOXYD12_FULL_33_39]OHE14272.1 MAG: flagellin [Sulfurimonas sp. RIFOXYD2_FULL_34_21]DAB28872.1 MAG TPA: flagellin [Sulfurimonas sp. UBA10385]
MSFKINSNISALTANVNSGMNSAGINKSLGALASGSMLNSSAYNSAGLSIANQFSAQVAAMGQSIMNSNDSIGLVQVADGALEEYGDILENVRRLSIQASNDTLNSDDRAIIQKEIDSLMSSADDIAKSTKYNGINLLDGTGGSAGDGTFVTHTGANSGESQNVKIGDAQTASILGAPIDVTSQAGASSAIDTIDSAINSINGIRADLGAAQNQLISNIKNTSVTQVNIASAESQMRDLDFAAESANFSKLNILSQSGSFAQSQANASQSSVLNLFR